MEVGSTVLEDIVFRGVEFSVKIELEERILVVEISDPMTADQWRGEFDPAYIEDLTRKTGNFKQFPIFCSMLESAVRKTSESVTLDLLTYADLELLRNRKAGVVGRPRGQQQSPALSAKRYLILIYTVEFDRIHYPLPLPYQGKPDPAALQKEIRVLRAELNALTNHGGHKPAETEICRLRAELGLVKEEKEALAVALERLRGVGAAATPGGGARGLLDVVRGLEEQLVRERAKTQRSASKRGQEQRFLVEQLEELRASERSLRIRVKGLTNELALLRRGRLTPTLSGRSNSRGDGEIRRSLSRERSVGRVLVRARSGSRERIEDRGLRSEDRGRRADSSGPLAHIRRPSPSPTGLPAPRFDPTAYIQDRQRRQREAELKRFVPLLLLPSVSLSPPLPPVLHPVWVVFLSRVSSSQRKVRRDMLASPVVLERGRSRSREAYKQVRTGSTGRGRSLSVESRRSRQSSENSLADMDELAQPLTSRGRKQTYNGPTMPRGRHVTRKPLCSTPTYRMRPEKESSLDAGTDLTEIDARLQALQDYMRDLDTGH
ncbi:centrosomal protein CCDC61 isoform X1 [Hypomesus transpacificus]|uniref:centrosomal protein CCDC61 isoform X1 n=1 Tax=Hypomesus transpacificus TaxID=137520 RepID=UPI001F0776E0|nr:centrosomal protein CCDC61 isoform X1 [Hypomesus transpacificus]XP_046876934.1 centrosomal protein CCDC61 isoform X1 [Hypomesus transpacificus]XP_046876935.1 centrosomal protein CCDC61 isoform X1 [Hypomesus transpacificus]XP_046876936.1 centrosomal protein CCDC61 isoform X1 [Hypomesus transpacificus]